jgi:integrase
MARLRGRAGRSRLERRHVDRDRRVVTIDGTKTRGSRREVPLSTRALAARVAPFELARIMGTSIRMIERHYGALVAGAADSIAARLDAHEGRAMKAL